MNLPKEWPEKGIKYMQEGHNKDRKGYTDGYNQCWEDCTAALPAVVEEARREERERTRVIIETLKSTLDFTVLTLNRGEAGELALDKVIEALTQPTDVTDN